MDISVLYRSLSSRPGLGTDGRGQLAGTGRHSGFPTEIHQARRHWRGPASTEGCTGWGPIVS